MKKIYLSLLSLAVLGIAHAQVKFDALSFSPEFPRQGERVSFKFNANVSPLTDEKKVEIAVYLFNNKGRKVVEPKLVQKGKEYSGTIQLDSNTSCIAFAFSANDQKDVNGGKGFIVPVYTTNQQPVKDFYGSAGNLYGGYGEYLLGLTTDMEKSLSLFEEGIKAYPELKNDHIYLNNYLFTIHSARKKEAEPIIVEKLKAIEAKDKLQESDYSLLAQWYGRFKRKSIADSFTTLMKSKYPAGGWIKDDLIKRFYAEKDADKKKVLLTEYLTAYPAKDEEDKQMINNLKSRLAAAYGDQKDYTAFRELTSSMDDASRYSTYNNLAWKMAEDSVDLNEAKAMVKEAATWSKKEMVNSTRKKPGDVTTKQWIEQRNRSYAMYGDTYGFILYRTGDYATGLPFAKDAATFYKFKDADYNERYALTAEKAAPAAETKKIIEQFVKDGVATAKTKEAFKRLYIKEKNSAEGYEEYLAALEMEARQKKKAEIAKSMINEAAPAFSLKDFDGNTVSLASLKGNVVIVDFWATWCGPCIASMPGMKLAEEKLKARGDVKFLFVDTWENVENKKENAMEFMKKNNYAFHVLMDDDNKVVSDFNVRGIPTKFIIDKKGNIRFKAIGFSGSADGLVDEVNTMVEMAAAN